MYRIRTTPNKEFGKENELQKIKSKIYIYIHYQILEI